MNLSDNSARNLQDAIRTYNNKFRVKGCNRVSEATLVEVHRSENYLKYHTPDDGNSFLTSKKMAELRPGWIPLNITPAYFKSHFRHIDKFKTIMLLWRYNHKDPLIFIEGKLCDGYHRAALAWHMGFKNYPLIMLKVKQ